MGRRGAARWARTYLERDMPTATCETKYHADREEDAPDGSLEEYVDPEDGVDGRVGLLFGKDPTMLVRTRRVE